MAFGIDLFATAPADTWAYSYNSGIHQYTLGDYFMQHDGDRVKSVYRFRDDPLLTADISGTMSADTLAMMETRLKAFVQQYARAMKENRLLPPAKNRNL